MVAPADDRGPVPVHHRASSLESCLFLCRVLSLPIAAAYVVWLTIPDETLHSWDITYYPPKERAKQVPAFLLFLFFTILISYGLINSTLVPSIDSVDAFVDDHTKRQYLSSDRRSAMGPTVAKSPASIPEIFDLDPATMVWKDTGPGQKKNRA